MMVNEYVLIALGLVVSVLQISILIGIVKLLKVMHSIADANDKNVKEFKDWMKNVHEVGQRNADLRIGNVVEAIKELEIRVNEVLKALDKWSTSYTEEQQRLMKVLEGFYTSLNSHIDSKMEDIVKDFEVKIEEKHNAIHKSLSQLEKFIDNKLNSKIDSLKRWIEEPFEIKD